MKKILLSFVLFAICCTCLCQNSTLITGKSYVSNTDIVVEKYNYILGTSYNKKLVLRKGTIFNLVNFDTTKNAIIKCWHFTESGSQKLNKESVIDNNRLAELGYVGSAENETYLLMSLTDLNNLCVNYYSKENSFSWGFTVMPYKLRFGNRAERTFNFTNNFTIGITSGWSYRFKGRHEKNIAFLTSVGVSAFSVDSATTKGRVKEPIATAAFTPALGIVYDHDGFQVGIFTGKDYCVNELSRNWVYQAKPWLSVGMGFSLFSKNKTNSSTDKDKQTK